ncbi:hypothetical protein [Thermosphaera sp.]
MPRGLVTTGLENNRSRASLLKTLCRLISFLLEREFDFFSDDYLNSEGRKLLEKIIEIMLETNPEYGRRITTVRRKGSREEVVALLAEIGEKYQCW